MLSSNSEQNQVSQTFFSKNRQANLIVDNKYKVDYIDAIINGIDEKIILDKSQRFNRIDLSSYLKHGMNTVTFYFPAAQESNKGLRMYIEVAGKNEYSN